jgi:hypothetical protein
MKRWPLCPMKYLAKGNKLLVEANHNNAGFHINKRPANRLHK